MSNASGLGKPLAGINILPSSVSGPLTQSVISSIISGATTFNNVDITGGTIDGVTIGSNTPGPIYTTTLISGLPSGLGYEVVFYGNTPGDYASWNPNLNTWNISGDLNVTDTADLGNIRIQGNTISATNTGGNINLSPNGSGIVTVNSAISQVALSGNISFSTLSGYYSLNTSGNINLTSSAGSYSSTTSQSQLLSSQDSTITLQTSTNKITRIISFIALGNPTLITTTTPHLLTTGETITISGSNSTPNMNGTWSVNTIVDATHFTISLTSPITSTGNSGNFTVNGIIYLDAGDSIFIPYNVLLEFGSSYNNIYADTLDDLYINTKNNLNLTASNIIIPDLTPIHLGSSTRTILSDGTDIVLNSPTVVINGDLLVNGNTTQVNSTEVTIEDIFLTLGGAVSLSVDDSKDRGILYQWNDSVASRLGFFGMRRSNENFIYIPEATVTDGVVSGTLGSIEVSSVTADTISVNTSISTGTVNACVINCVGTLDLKGSVGIILDTTNTITIHSNAVLAFDDSSNNYIYTNSSNGSLNIVSSSTDNININTSGTGNIFLESSSVILPTNSKLYLSGSGSSQYISSSSTSISINSNNLISFNQTSGGIKLTQGLPLIFNNANTSNIFSDSSNLYINSGNYINLIPGSSGNINIPVNKNLEFGSTNNYIYGDSYGNMSAISNNNIFLTPNASVSGKVIIPTVVNLQIGNSTQYIVSDNSNNLTTNSANTLNLTSVNANVITSLSSSIYLTSGVSIIIPQNVPLQLGLSSEYITSDNSSDITVHANNNISINSVYTVSIISNLSNIYLTVSSGNSVILPKNIHLQLGASTEYLTSDLNNSVYLNSNNGIFSTSQNATTIKSTTSNIFLTPAVSNCVILPKNIHLQLGVSTEYITSDNSSNITINANNGINVDSINATSINSSSNSIYLSPYISVILPQNIPLQFGLSTEYLTSDGSSNLTLNGNNNLTLSIANNISLVSNTSNILLSPATTVNIPVNKNLVFGSSNNYIVGQSGNLNLNSTSGIINLNSNNTINSGNFTVNGTNTNLNTPNIYLLDPIPTVGYSNIVSDNTDRGIQFNWNNGTSALQCFFGVDNTDRYF